MFLSPQRIHARQPHQPGTVKLTNQGNNDQRSIAHSQSALHSLLRLRPMALDTLDYSLYVLHF